MISKEKWSEIILDYHNGILPNTYKRDLNIDYEINIKRAISIIGPRRVGKTYEMFNIIKQISSKYSKKRTIYINFERVDLALVNISDLLNLLTVYYELYPDFKNKKVWLFLDEIQNVNNWEKFVRNCLDNNICVFISGSSSKLLSKEISTSMGGRNLSYLLLPLSFKEYLLFKDFKLKKYYSSVEKIKINNFLKDYFLYGGYPEVCLFNNQKESILNDIYNTAIYRDVVKRNNIKNETVLKFLINALLNSKEFSINSFYNFLKSKNLKITKNTLYRYINNLSDVYLLYLLRRYGSYKKIEQTKPKIYFFDNGILSINNINDKGRLLENLVFIELYRRNFDFFYYKNENTNKEVDFVIYKNKKPIELIQVCYNLDNLNTYNREVESLISNSDNLNCNLLKIITFDVEKIELINRKKIYFIPLWKWLLEN
jgi:uncharacterized protein